VLKNQLPQIKDMVLEWGQVDKKICQNDVGSLSPGSVWGRLDEYQMYRYLTILFLPLWE